MKRTETSPSADVLKKSQPEEFDLVILGGGTGSTILRGRLVAKASASQSSIASILAATSVLLRGVSAQRCRDKTSPDLRSIR